LYENKICTPPINTTIKNRPKAIEGFKPSKIGSDDFTTISLKKLMAMPQRLPIIMIIPNRYFIHNHPSTLYIDETILFLVFNISLFTL
jgi:hypothetical protein